MLLNREFRAEIKKVERHWKSNLIIRLYILVLSLVAGFVYAFVWLPNGFMWYGYCAIIPSVIWTSLVIIFRLCRLQPIHPGVHVGLELILWMDMVCVQTFAYIHVLRMSPWNPQSYNQNYNSDEVETAWIANMYANVSLSTISILHFYLFVRACNDTSDRRSQEISTRAAVIATEMVKNMEDRGTFHRRDSELSYGYRHIFNADEAGRVVELGNLHNTTGFTSAYPASSSFGRISRTPTVRTGRSMFSDARTQYSHTRSMSVPIPTSPMSLRTARTDEPSLYRLER